MQQLRTAAVSVLATLAVLGALSAAKRPAREYYDLRTATTPDARPFSGAVRAGDTVYLSGTLGLDANRRAPDDPEAEARLVLDGLKSKLEQAGMTMDDLVSVQIFCSDVAQYEMFNRVYRTYFTKEYPARAFIGSGKLLFDARFELQGVAVKR